MQEGLIEDTDSQEEVGPVREGALLQDRYEIRKRLGAGGFAKVFRAFDRRLERDVAIKFLDLGSMGVQGKMMDNILDRFQREATLAGKIQHVNVVNIYDTGNVDGDPRRPYIVMELLAGMDLDDYIKHKGPLAPKRLLPLFVSALDALGMAHELGIVHKDLKPSNLFLSNPGMRSEAMRIVDFGIAHIKNPHGDPNEPEGGRLTGTGQIFGTMQYLAPEYISHQIVGPPLDVYQMALILIELLCGTPVIRTSNPMDCLRIHTFGLIEIPQYIKESALAPVLLRALAADPADRYQNAREFADALSEVDASLIPLFPKEAGSVGWVRMMDGNSGEIAYQSTSEHARPTTEQLRIESQLQADSPMHAQVNAGATQHFTNKPAQPDTSLELSGEFAAPPAGNEKKILGVLVVAILVVGGIVVGIIAANSGKDKDAADPAVAQRPADKPADKAPEITPPPADVKPDDKPADKPDEKPPAEVKPAALPRVKVISSPAGATVWRGEIKLGQTPYEFLYTEEERNLVLQLRVELEGHKERNIEIHPQMTEPIALELEALPKTIKKNTGGGKTKPKPKDDEPEMKIVGF